MSRLRVVRALAASFLAGETTIDGIVTRAELTLGRPWPWLQPLAERYVSATQGRTRPRKREVIEFIARDPAFRRARLRHATELAVEQWLLEPQRMLPVPAAMAWHVPAIESTAALAEWLSVTPGELEWFADLRGLSSGSTRSPLTHYYYRIISKRSGSLRLIESPKSRLKFLQRRILELILGRIPSHPAAHGFVRGRSARTFVAPHVGRRVVLRMDLTDFFPSFGASRIQSLFRMVGYPENVADRLAGVCTNSLPSGIWKDFASGSDSQALRDARILYGRRHLPQGAPTSPALANLCTWRVDSRLQGLAESAGAAYTRYADDLAFSGDDQLERRVERFSLHVAAILLEEGFAVNHRKTRIMRRGVRQFLAGVVTNHHMNFRRTDFDRLKALLTNCVRRGPESQNRNAHARFRQHLEGRVAYVETINPAKGRRLRAILEKVEWK